MILKHCMDLLKKNHFCYFWNNGHLLLSFHANCVKVNVHLYSVHVNRIDIQYLNLKKTFASCFKGFYLIVIVWGLRKSSRLDCLTSQFLAFFISLTCSFKECHLCSADIFASHSENRCVFVSFSHSLSNVF